MNKPYQDVQDALDYMVATAQQWVANKAYQKFQDIPDGTFDEIDAQEKVLQEALKDFVCKAIPVRPTVINDDFWVKGVIQKRYECPSCKGLLFSGECCTDNDCRQAIDWSKDE